jgi:hypothetical protein
LTNFLNIKNINFVEWQRKDTNKTFILIAFSRFFSFVLFILKLQLTKPYQLGWFLMVFLMKAGKTTKWPCPKKYLWTYFG